MKNPRHLHLCCQSCPLCCPCGWLNLLGRAAGNMAALFLDSPTSAQPIRNTRMNLDLNTQQLLGVISSLSTLVVKKWNYLTWYFKYAQLYVYSIDCVAVMNWTHLRAPVAAQLHCHQSRGSLLADAGVTALPEETGSPLSPRTPRAQLPGFLPFPHWENGTEPQQTRMNQGSCSHF